MITGFDHVAFPVSAAEVTLEHMLMALCEDPDAGLVLAACLPREDARDAFISRKAASFAAIGDVFTGQHD